MGRHIRKMSLADALATSSRRASSRSLFCSDCPKWRANYCRISARFMVPTAKACAYGKILIVAARRNAENAAKRRGQGVPE